MELTKANTLSTLSPNQGLTLKKRQREVTSFPGYTWKIGGFAGLGIMTTGLIFSKACSRSGFYIFDYVEYPSLIRGGHNVIETRFSQNEVFSQEKGVDLLVALNRETIDLHKKELKKDGGVIFDPDQFKVTTNEFGAQKVSLFPVPLAKIVEKIKVGKVTENNITLGVSIALFNLNLKILFSVIEDIFKRKGKEIVLENKKAAQAGYDYAKSKKFKLKAVKQLPKITRSPKVDKLVITGNEAIGLGAIVARCRFFVAYPMTPASSILHYLASKALDSGMVVRHAEDEIGVINEAIGASFAGARSMLATSGGGFALMTEAVALAGLTETPLVIVVAQRPGPATGMPTWTGQEDLLFIIRSGHGEFPKIVLSPGDQEEAFWLTFQAFNLADIYQTPVFIVSDKYLSESHKSIEKAKLEAGGWRFDRGKIKTMKQSGKEAMKPFKRYQIASDGISPRILPGTKGFYYQANSYEHLEDGHTSEDAKNRVKQVDKRAKKVITFLKIHFQMPKLYGPKKAGITLVGWGSVKGPVVQALKQCNHLGVKPFNFLHFSYIWPIDGERVKKELEKHKRLVLVENNSWGQFGKILRQETGIEIKDRLLKYDGRPFYPEEIIKFIKDL